MSNLITKYEQRLRERDISSCNVTTLEGESGPDDRKFDSSGKIKPFYGLTCIAWVDQKTELGQKLSSLQNTFREELQKAGLGDVFAFLEPESFHVTICDIEARPVAIPSQEVETRIHKVREAFNQIGTPGKVTSQIRGIGLKRTITALVRFNNELELGKVLDMEETIKQSTGKSVREFAGHISLAYLVRHPGENIETIKEILLSYKDQVSGEFTFSQFDLTYFTNMNTFIPLLTINLKDGQVTRH